jgi:hypothetical protein
MKLSYIIVVMAFLAAFASDSWGKTKDPPPKADQQPATQQERGTENSPVVVRVLPAEKSKDDVESEQARQEADRQLVKLTGDLASYTRLLFLATGLLALVTVGLVYFSFRQARDNKRSIAVAETSTRIAERALTELEAPFLAVKISASGIDWQKITDPNFDDLKFSIVNYGRTPAHILELLDGVAPHRVGEGLPPAIDPDKTRGKPMPYGIIAPPSSTTQEFSVVTNIDFWEGSTGGAIRDVTMHAYF